MAKSFYETIKGLVPASFIDHHESDLYVRDLPLVRAIIRQFGLNSSYFTSKVDGQRWIDVPFAYEPFWEKKTSSRSKTKASHATMRKADITLRPAADDTYAVLPVPSTDVVRNRLRRAGISWFLGFDPKNAADRAEIERRIAEHVGTDLTVAWGPRRGA